MNSENAPNYALIPLIRWFMITIVAFCLVILGLLYSFANRSDSRLLTLVSLLLLVVAGANLFALWSASKGNLNIDLRLNRLVVILGMDIFLVALSIPFTSHFVEMFGIFVLLIVWAVLFQCKQSMMRRHT